MHVLLTLVIISQKFIFYKYFLKLFYTNLEIINSIIIIIQLKIPIPENNNVTPISTNMHTLAA